MKWLAKNSKDKTNESIEVNSEEQLSIDRDGETIVGSFMFPTDPDHTDNHRTESLCKRIRIASSHR